MRIKEKLYFDRTGLEAHGPINIVAFGDSVTHGALAPGEINQRTVYWNLLKNKLNAVRSYMPVNVINAGIGGTTAKESLDRVERDVLSHKPDAVIICFGLNDINFKLEDFTDSLRIIFEKCKLCVEEVIFMTPNMLNTYVADDTCEEYRNYAKVMSEYQNSGRMDLYMSEAIKVAEQVDVKVCDCYSEWKKLSEKEDTTMMLINRINHPTKEMHELFASKLFEILFDGEETVSKENSNTMYR